MFFLSIASMQKQALKSGTTSKVSSTMVSKRPSTAPPVSTRGTTKNTTASKNDPKTRNTTANKENKDVIMSKSSSSDSSSPSTMMAKVKKERVSLVQRQTRFAANVQQNTNTHRPLTRSATTPALPGRGRTTTSKVTSSTKPKLPEASNKSINGALPFGSTSSISSSSSNRSWADTVKGLKTPRSVEDLKMSSFSSKRDSTATLEPEDGGWETVKSRTRSKYSPSANKIKISSAVANSTKTRSKAAILETEEIMSKSDDSIEESEIVKKDEAIALVEQEEKSLQREIRETEKAEMPLDDSENCTPSKMDSLFDGLSWADQIDLEEQLLESRYPGRAIQLHEKLSSPARKREPQEAFKVHQEKQKNAKMRRLKFQEEKAAKLSGLNARIEEVVAQKEQLISECKGMCLKCLQRWKLLECCF